MWLGRYFEDWSGGHGCFVLYKLYTGFVFFTIFQLQLLAKWQWALKTKFQNIPSQPTG